ncbi:hypothetical protein N9L47_09065 [Rhodobacteraceae bacterium]|nr:hypothetical protein [Paracoccaceae bacterium]
MRQAAKYSALGFSAVCICLAVDAAVGLGTAQWLADLCLTDASDDMVGMAMKTVTPAPFLVVSTILAGIGIALIASEDRETAMGLTPPDAAEHASILSAIVLVAAVHGRTTEQDIANVFQIVTNTDLEPELAQLAFAQFKQTDPNTLTTDGIATANTSIARRRILAAALLMGCVANRPSEAASVVIENLAAIIGATSEDITAARTALQNWTKTDSGLQGVPLITLLRTKPLGLRPA